MDAARLRAAAALTGLVLALALLVAVPADAQVPARLVRIGSLTQSEPTSPNFQVRNHREFEAAISTAGRAEALLIVGAAFFFNHHARLAALSNRARLPTMAPWRQFAEASGLMSYGADVPDLFRRAAGSVHRIVKGAKPGDMPVQQASKLEMAINLRTAKALGLTLPQQFVLRADRVIEEAAACLAPPSGWPTEACERSVQTLSQSRTAAAEERDSRTRRRPAPTSPSSALSLGRCPPQVVEITPHAQVLGAAVGITLTRS